MQHMTIRISESPVRAASFLKAHTTFLVSDPDRVVLTSHEREMNETKGRQPELVLAFRAGRKALKPRMPLVFHSPLGSLDREPWPRMPLTYHIPKDGRAVLP